MSDNVNTKQPAKNVWSGEDRSSRILRRVSLDCLSGAIAALTLSPIVAAVDKAVVETSSGSKTVLQSLKGTFTSLVKSPVKFFASVEFRWIYLVYSSTYMTNNSIDSLCKVFQISDVVPKLVGVTAVNMTASILKDRAFAIYFGKKGNTKVAPISMLIWLLRDVISMAVAFVLPMRFAAYLQTREWSEGSSKKFAQFTLPMFSQLFLTPVHLLGYDFYNFPVRSLGERAQYIRGIYGPTAVVRIFRMGSAYGVGGVSNITLRNNLISRFEGKDWDKSYK